MSKEIFGETEPLLEDSVFTLSLLRLFCVAPIGIG